MTLGVLLLLMCVYQLYYTNFQANRAQHRVGTTLTKEWAAQPVTPGDTPDKFVNLSDGDGFAFIRIPRLGKHWVKPIVQGVTLNDLAKGVAHYPESAWPGRVGNFAVAGHRATHGEPFRDLPRVRPGDVVVIETQNNWYTYVIDSTKITTPTDVGVVLPVPNRPGVRATQRLITLTTCNPRWASYQRFIVFGHLESVQSKALGLPPALVSTGG